MCSIWLKLEMSSGPIMMAKLEKMGCHPASPRRCWGAAGLEGQEAPPVRHNDCLLGVATETNKAGSADSPHLPLLCLEQVRSSRRSTRRHSVSCCCFLAGRAFFFYKASGTPGPFHALTLSSVFVCVWCFCVWSV